MGQVYRHCECCQRTKRSTKNHFGYHLCATCRRLAGHFYDLASQFDNAASDVASAALRASEFEGDRHARSAYGYANSAEQRLRAARDAALEAGRAAAAKS